MIDGGQRGAPCTFILARLDDNRFLRDTTTGAGDEPA
jgi:hypothetical protein